MKAAVKLFRMLVLAITTLGFAAAAAARGSSSKIEEIEQTLSPRVARCVINRHSNDVAALLNMLPGSAAESKIFRRIEADFPACFGNDNGEAASWLASYNNPAIRAGLVRAMLQAVRDDLPAESPAGATQSWYQMPQDEVEKRQLQNTIFANDLGACLAGKNWVAVRGIILAVDPVMEKREFFINSSHDYVMRREAGKVNAHMAEVLPSIAGCVPFGVKLTLTRLTLRRILEETAYHATYGLRTKPSPKAMSSGNPNA